MSVKPIPEGYHSVTPYLIVDDGAQALDFYREALGAVELYRMEHEGKIGHAEMKVGDSAFMLADAQPEMGYHSPRSLGGSPVSMLLYVNNVDDQFAKAVSKGAEVVRPVENQFYGDRAGTVKDPYGHVWTLATHVEDLTPEEIDRRARERFS